MLQIEHVCNCILGVFLGRPNHRLVKEIGDVGLNQVFEGGAGRVNQSLTWFLFGDFLKQPSSPGAELPQLIPRCYEQGVSKPSALKPESRDPQPGFLSYQVENAFSEIENPAGLLPSRTGFGHASRKQSPPSKLWVSNEADNPLLPAAVCLKSSFKLHL